MAAIALPAPRQFGSQSSLGPVAAPENHNFERAAAFRLGEGFNSVRASCAFDNVRHASILPTTKSLTAAAAFPEVIAEAIPEVINVGQWLFYRFLFICFIPGLSKSWRNYRLGPDSGRETGSANVRNF